MISVPGAETLSLAEIEAILSASGSLRFVGCGNTKISSWAERLLSDHKYLPLGQRGKGLLRAYVEHITWLGRAQFTRLVGAYAKAGRIAPKPSLPGVFDAITPWPTWNCWPALTRHTRG